MLPRCPRLSRDRRSEPADEARMTIPLVDLKAQYLSLKGEIDAAIGRVLARATFIHGEEVALFEREFAEFCQIKEAVGVSSGTDALCLALKACDIGPGDEVITTPLTFVATVEAICQVGASPILVDVDPNSCNLDPTKIEWAITERTKAIVPVHLYGNPAEMDTICHTARVFGIKVIEDAAQAHGAKYKGQPVGTLGDAGCFSFYPSTNLGAFGDAGMVVTGDSRIAERVRLLRDHGRNDNRSEHLCVGFNSRMDTLQAAILRVKIRMLDRWNARRRDIASLYRRLLRGSGVILPSEDASGEPSYHSFVIRTSQRGHLRRALASAGIETGVHFPVPVHLQPAYRHLGRPLGALPVSELAAQEVLSLPMYAELTDQQVYEVSRTVKQVLSHAESGSPEVSAAMPLIRPATHSLG